MATRQSGRGRRGRPAWDCCEESPDASPRSRGRSGGPQASSRGFLKDTQPSSPSPMRTTVEKLEAPADEVTELSAFHEFINQLTAEHDKVLEELKTENAELKEKMESVLTTTWTLGQEGGLNGSPKKPKFGELELICYPGSAQKSEARFSVPKERVLAQFDKGPIAYPVREGWTHIDYFTKEMADYLKIDDQQRAITDVVRLKEKAEGEPEGPPPGRFVIHPASNKRLAWDAISLVLIIWDMFSIPISMYGLEQVLFLTIMDWLTLLFWTADVGASLCTGLLVDGKYILDAESITNIYFRSWFPLDICILLPDWVITIWDLMNGDKNSGNVLGVFRFLRVIRIIRLLRLAKLKRIITRIKDMIANELVFMILSFVQMVVQIFIVNHFLGSTFYFIGDMLSTYDQPNWIDKISLRDEGLLKRYLTSFKWSLTKFSLATNNVEAVSEVEAVYELFTAFIGLTVFCAFTASIDQWMLQAKQLRGEYPKQIWLLRRYLKQNHIGLGLTERLHHFLESYEKRKEARVSVQRLTILNWLTDSLRLELQYLTSYRKLNVNPTMKYVETTSQALMHQLCGTAGRVKNIHQEEAVFTKGNHASFMCVIDTGTCSYSKREWEKKVVLESEVYFCESAFWVNWICVGDLFADTDVQIIYMDVKPFMSIMSANAKMHATMSAYSTQYSEWLGSMEESEMVDVFMNHMELFTAKKNERKHAAMLKQAIINVKKLDFDDE